jgi:O-antigen/teichoic acid export membrane protein
MNNTTYRLAAGVAIAAALILAWLSLGVGIIGRDGDPTNLMYFGVLAVGIIGSFIARFRARGMSRALFATALAQTSVATIALTAQLGRPWSGPLELMLLNGFFVALFAGSAWLFRRAAHG